MNLFKIWGEIAIHNDSANQALDETTGRATKSESKMSKAFKRIGTAVAAAFAVDRIAGFGKAIVETAAEVSAEVSAFEQIMGSYSQQATEKMHKVAEATGVVDTRLTGAMTSMTAKFKGLGFGIEDATDLAARGLTIASDAAAFWDMSLQESQEHLNSFINGSYEGGEAIGLFANDTQMAMYAVQEGIIGSTKDWANLEEATKQATRLEFAENMQKQSGAQGQAAKEAGQYANVIANLGEKWRQFKALIGDGLLENVATPAMRKLSDTIDAMTEGFNVLSGKIELSNSRFAALEPIINRIQNGVQQLHDIFDPLIEKIRQNIAEHLPEWKEKLEELKDSLSALSPLFEAVGFIIVASIGQLGAVLNGVISAISGVLTALSGAVDFIGSVLTIIVGIFTFNIDKVKEGFSDMKDAIIKVFSGLWDGVVGFVQGFVDGIVEFFTNLWDVLVGHSIVPDTINDIIRIWAGLWDGVKSHIDAFVDNIVGKFNAIKTKTSEIFGSIKDFLFGTWESIKNKIGGTTDSIKNKVSGGFNSIKAAIVNPISGAKDVVTNLFGTIKTNISDKINGARDSVGNAINRMKSFFNFSWSLPNLKLPHISIKGRFNLAPPEVPRFGISWYKKAMDNAMLLNSPTIFGTAGNQLLGGGEAGLEVVSGADTLMSMIRSTVHAEVSKSNTEPLLQQLVAILQQFLPEVAKNKGVYLDSGVLVGQLAPAMDVGLGNISRLKERGQ